MSFIRRAGMLGLLAWLLAGQGSVSGVSETPATSAAHLSYVESGDPRGIPVVFVHAFPLNKAMWADQIEALKKQARVIAFDIRGLGQSRLDAPYTLEFVVDDLIDLLDRLKIDKAVVCGLSMGGFVALRAIERNPERFRGLVLADTKSEPDSDSSKLGRYKALKTIREQGLPSFIDAFLKTSIAPDVQAQQPQVLELAKSIAGANSPEGISAALLALTSRMDTTPGLADIRVPSLILHGELDSVIPVAAAQSLHKKIMGSTLAIIPRAGHLSNLENPAAFNAQLLQFLKGLPEP